MGTMMCSHRTPWNSGSLLPLSCPVGSWGLVSESGGSWHGDGDPGRGDRRRRGLELAKLPAHTLEGGYDMPEPEVEAVRRIIRPRLPR